MSLNIKNGDELIPVAGTPKVTRSSLELENVDNTADLDKPVSTATQAALDLKADITDLDKKANKTFIEAIDNTTSVVTVPENVAGFAAISKICGKTIKDGEVLKSATVKSVVSSNNIWNENWELGGHDSSGLKDNAKDKIRSVDAIKVNPDIDYSLNVPIGSGRILFYTTSNAFINSVAPTFVNGRALFRTPINCGFIRFNLSTDYGTTYNNNVSVCTGLPFKTTVSLSEIVKDLPDYGIEGNVLDLENMKYYHNFVSRKLTEWTWTLTNAWGGTSFEAINSNAKAPSSASVAPNAICGIYTVVDANTSYAHTVDKSITIHTNNRMYINDSSATNVDKLKEIITGKEFVYELATPEVIDLTNILYPFAVESGGTITFENEHNLDVNNTVLYKKEVL